ncbi:LacI family DNA-binding transcriptional regulator [Rubellimicrobium sp. CFH 75288]|uniref:LacI family DNA-binding transcriptional regulator n=1 Tax=Rubellimicrobium sp. CFH 75288 TaxID=2697034 RepID=UPI001411EE6B|nr:LacI family DNA-binding transcriptional regulator [Rubellimicrobium sp. CFH 75288]NAZ36197.1 substrate-binding domain-containing protein [Rubellimicrobium sp. CFH 75288]
MAKKYKSNQIHTLRDVARASGVSAVTASRALRTPDRVAPETLARVRAAVARLGYVPNPAAQTLASGRSRVIGVVIPSVTNSVFADLLRGVMDAAGDGPFQPQIANTRYLSSREEAILRLFASQRPAGMIVAGIDQSDASRAILRGMGCPVVQVMEIGPDPIDMMIGGPQAEAARAAVAHLIDQGYRRIAFLGARMDPRAQRRLFGYRQEIASAGLPERVLTTPRPSSVTVGRQLMGDLLALHPDTDAVFSNNDDVALGALFECTARGIRVPAQMGIAGFNDLDLAAGAEPGLTTVRTHRYRMGSEAMAMIAAALAGDRPADPVRDTGFELVVRASTRRLPEGAG